MKNKFFLLSLMVLLILSFNVLLSAPTITTITPFVGPSQGGTTVMITGSGFTGTTSVLFGTTPASYVLQSDTLITATSPNHSPEVISVTVIASSPSSPTPQSFYVYQGNGQAYISNNGDTTVSVIDTTAQSVGTVDIGYKPFAIAITPDGTKAYIVNTFNNSVSVIHVADNIVDTSVIGVGAFPLAIAITPDGTKAYVVNTNDNSVSVINVSDNTINTTLNLGTMPNASPLNLAISPDGTKVYVADHGNNLVSVIDVANNSISSVAVSANPVALSIVPDGTQTYVVNENNMGPVSAIDTVSNMVSTVNVETNPTAIAITPNGAQAYVANINSASVSVINTTFPPSLNTTVAVEDTLIAVAIIPDGTKAYVVNYDSDSVSIINTTTIPPTAIPTPLVVGNQPNAIAITPDGITAYVINQSDRTVSVINTLSDTVSSSTIPVGADPVIIAITPDQAPLARFTANLGVSGSPSIFDASLSVSPSGTIVNYFWDFGDGQTLTALQPVVSHVYANPGVYPVTLTVTNSAGTSTQQIFNLSSNFIFGFFSTSPSVSHNGGPTASITQTITVLAPLLLPVITMLDPSSGLTSGGTTVTITGSNFTGTTSVFFGDTAALSFTLNSDTSLTAVTPPGVPGIVDVRVSTSAGQSAVTAADEFTYFSFAFLPIITQITPHLGPTSGGTTLIITGSHFTGATAVFFGNTPVLSFTVNSDTSLTVITPPGSPGTLDVSVVTPAGQSAFTLADQFTYFSPVPPPLLPPQNLRVRQVKNEFATQTDRINILTWQASESPALAAYYIYRDKDLTQLIATIPANKKSRFEDHNRRKGQTNHYFVVSVDEAGNMSAPAHVKIKE